MKYQLSLGLFAAVAAVLVGVDDFVTLVLEFLADFLEPGADFLAIALHVLEPILAQALQLFAQAVLILIGGILQLLVQSFDLFVLFLSGCFEGFPKLLDFLVIANQFPERTATLAILLATYLVTFLFGVATFLFALVEGGLEAILDFCDIELRALLATLLGVILDISNIRLDRLWIRLCLQ